MKAEASKRAAAVATEVEVVREEARVEATYYCY